MKNRPVQSQIINVDRHSLFCCRSKLQGLQFQCAWKKGAFAY